ncbi:MAG TPA: tRNA-dihydrouridine synthase [Candidatus Saccharimonadales bacterium]|nr:tRNA-dihydrouridine synthase [Candidatus Saccharimonadales bacterium]
MSFLDQLPKPFLVLAPMDDVTDTVFRQIIASCSPPDLSFTEFVNVDGLQSPGREKLMHKLRFSPRERPIIAQLWGLNPDNFHKTTKDLIKLGFDGVDLNFGCPVKKVVKTGACAALINDRNLAGDIVDAVKDAAGDHFPVSVKTRVGFTAVDLSWPEFLLAKKLNLLSIHGRTAKQQSKVPADWALIGKVREMRDLLCPATKIVGNGDVLNRKQAENLAKKYQLDGVMVGRGIFHDPFLFAQESPWLQWPKDQKLNLFRKHIELFDKTWKHGEYKFETLKKFCKIYISGFDGASDIRTGFIHTKSPIEALNFLDKNL